MSEERNFDDHIRQEFINYSPQVAPHIWENIIAQREKRKPAGFWVNFFNYKTTLLLTALIIAGTVGGLFLSHNLKGLPTGKSSLPGSSDKSIIANNNSVDNKTGTTGNNKPANPDNNKVSTIDVINTTTIAVPSKQPLSGNGIKKQMTVDATNTTANPRQSSISKIKKSYLAHHYKIDKTNLRITSIAAGEGDEAPLNDNSGTGINRNLSASLNKQFATSTKRDITTPAPRLFFDAASKQVLNITPSSTSIQSKYPGVHFPECPSVEKDAAGNKRYFEIYIAPDYALRTLTDTANSVYLQKRKESATFSSAFSAGIRYTKVFSNGMSVKLGVNYSQINEKFTFIQSNTVQINYTIDANTGDTTGSYTVRGTRYQTTYNHYRSFDIPLTIGYELGNGKLHANINAGIVANIYSWQKGNVLDTSLHPVSITTGEGGSSLYQFKTNLGLGATAGVSLYYKLNEQLHLFAEPYIRYNFQPMGAGNLSLQQKYTTLGLRLGLRFDLPYPEPGNVIKR